MARKSSSVVWWLLGGTIALIAWLSGNSPKAAPPPAFAVSQPAATAKPVDSPPAPSDAQLLFVANRLLLLTHSGQFRSRDLHARALAALALVHVGSPEYAQAEQLRRGITAAYAQNGGKPPTPDDSSLPSDLVQALQGQTPAATRPSTDGHGTDGRQASAAPSENAIALGRALPPAPPLYHPELVASPECQGNGSCYGDISAATGLPKTVEVHGYTRSNGTYVRGHYRSK